jgi:hypothetical protein
MAADGAVEPARARLRLVHDREPGHNLPAELPSFIGREEELATLQQMLAVPNPGRIPPTERQPAYEAVLRPRLPAVASSSSAAALRFRGGKRRDASPILHAPGMLEVFVLLVGASVRR